MNAQLNTVQDKNDAPFGGGNKILSYMKSSDTKSDLATLTIYDNGIIRSCNIACAELLGSTLNNLNSQHISVFLPQLKSVPLLNGETVNPYLKFLSRVGHQFEVVDANGVMFFSAVFFNDVEDFDRHCLRVIFQPIKD